MVRPLFTATLVLLLAAPLAEAQQNPAKTKVKTKRAASAATANGLPAEGALPAPPPGGPDGPGGLGGPRPPHRGPGGPRGGVQALSEFSGTLTEYTAGNDEQLYDGFTLKTSSGTETVRFPRHLAQALMAAAKAGSSITLSGFRDTDPEGRSALRLVSLTAGGQTVRDTPPARPTTPPTEEAATARGTISRLDTDPQGRTRAAVLSDGTILHLPPAAAAQLAEKLKVGASVAATGNLRPAQPGEVAIRPVRVLRTQTITLDGVQFLVR